MNADEGETTGSENGVRRLRRRSERVKLRLSMLRSVTDETTALEQTTQEASTGTSEPTTQQTTQEEIGITEQATQEETGTTEQTAQGTKTSARGVNAGGAATAVPVATVVSASANVHPSTTVTPIAPFINGRSEGPVVPRSSPPPRPSSAVGGFRMLRCTFCSKQFTIEWMLRRHISSHKRKSAPADLHRRRGVDSASSFCRPGPCQSREDAYACCYCYKRFSDPRDLRNHQRMHTERAFCCNKCPLTFESQWMLQGHMMFGHNHLARAGCGNTTVVSKNCGAFNN